MANATASSQFLNPLIFNRSGSGPCCVRRRIAGAELAFMVDLLGLFRGFTTRPLLLIPNRSFHSLFA
jgi:hypothetical protein